MVEPRNLISQVHAIGAAVARTEIERRVLAAFEDVVASLVRKPVRLPWRPPVPVLAQLTAAVRRQPAGAWQAVERLWFFFWIHGLVADRLRLRSRGRTRPLRFSTAEWVVAVEANAQAQDIVHRVPLQRSSREDQYVAEALCAVSLSLSPPRLLGSLRYLSPRDVDWERGEIFLARRGDMGGPRALYRLGILGQLALGRLALFCAKPPSASAEAASAFLPVRWQRPGALTSLFRGWLRAHAPGHNVVTYLRAMRLLPLLHGPAIFAHVQAGALPAGWRAREDRPSRALARSSALPAPDGSESRVEEPEARAEVRFLVSQVSATLPTPERRRIARDLEGLLPALGASEAPPSNDALVTEWAIALLRTPRMRGNTVRTWLSGLYRDLSEHLLVSILSLSPDELAEFVIDLVFSQGTPDSQHGKKEKLKQFLRFVRSRHGGPALNWRDPDLAVPASSTALSLVTPDEVEEALRRLRADGSTEAAALTLAVILAFWCGLRRHEVCALSIDHILPGPWGSIRIERSKTRAGERAVPGALFTPAPTWVLVDDYQQARLAETGTGRAPLLVTPRGQAWDPDDLGRRIAQLLQAVTGRAVSMHSLRHGFATVTVIRWGVAQGRARWPEAWGQSAVAPASLAGVLQALGEDDALVLHRLSRLSGHAAPGVTVAHYIAMDVLRDAWMVDPTPLRLRSSVAADLLQCSAPAMYERVRPIERGWVDAWDVLRAQLGRLRRRQGGAHFGVDS